MEKQTFTTVIKPKSGWFDLHLKEVFAYRDLIYLFVKRNFVSKYKQTILGPAWAIIQSRGCHRTACRRLSSTLPVLCCGPIFPAA